MQHEESLELCFISTDTRGIPNAPMIEPTGDTDRVIDFAASNSVGPDYEELAQKLDLLEDRADHDLIPKFDAFFSMMGIT